MSLDYLHSQFGDAVPRENDVKESSKYDNDHHYLIIILNNKIFEFFTKLSGLWIEIIIEQHQSFSYFCNLQHNSWLILDKLTWLHINPCR